MRYPEVGKTYQVAGSERRVVEIKKDHFNREMVFYTKNGQSIVRKTRLEDFIKHYMPEDNRYKVEYHAQCKPLDQAFKQLDKQYCRHTNVREDRFFSAMVYRTCKDCGKALN